MRLDLWVNSTSKHGVPVTDEAMAFTNGMKKIFLVESDAEHDLVFALQYMYGAEILIQVLPQATHQEISIFLRSFPLVYTTWDPFDRNRI